MKSKVKTERSIYFDLMLTLTAIAFMSFIYYGVRVIAVCLIAMAVCITCDYICIKLRGRKYEKEDLCSLATGMVIGMMMPASISYNILILTCIVSIIIGKQVFGGRKNLIFSPAGVGFVFSVLSWKNEVMQYPKPYTKPDVFGDAGGSLFQSLSGMINLTGRADISNNDLIMGVFAGPQGATNLILLSVCAIILIFRRSISVTAFAGLIGTVSFYSVIYPINDSIWKSLLYMLTGNMLIFGAIYITSDVRTAPKNSVSGLVYGIITGLMTFYLTKVHKMENAVVFSSLIISPLAMALDEYMHRFKLFCVSLYNKRLKSVIERTKGIAKNLLKGISVRYRDIKGGESDE